MNSWFWMVWISHYHVFVWIRSVYMVTSPEPSPYKQSGLLYLKGTKPRSGYPRKRYEIYDMMLTDRRWKVHDFAKTLLTSYGSAFQIFTEKLNMSKISWKWVSRMQSFNQKQNRVHNLKECLSMMRRDRKAFVTNDWILDSPLPVRDKRKSFKPDIFTDAETEGRSTDDLHNAEKGSPKWDTVYLNYNGSIAEFNFVKFQTI